MTRGLAVVTGASSGLGRAYAESLAARGHPLLVVARREDRLRELAEWARARHGVAAEVVAADLATEEGLSACRAAIDAAVPAPEVVVLNAGFGANGAVWEAGRERQSEMVRLNCVAVVDLAAHVLPGMVARGRGALVVVSSAAAWQPVPRMATYAATKAFELHLTEAIAEELRGTGVRAIAVCPGPTRTEFSLVDRRVARPRGDPPRRRRDGRARDLARPGLRPPPRGHGAGVAREYAREPDPAARPGAPRGGAHAPAATRVEGLRGPDLECFGARKGPTL